MLFRVENLGPSWRRLSHGTKGHFLIIDEPELNLHPDNQRKIARILAKAVNRGFKIMMSTHSDYLIRELNHLIMTTSFKWPGTTRSSAVECRTWESFIILPAKITI